MSNQATDFVQESAKFVVACVTAVGLTTVVAIIEGGATTLVYVTAAVTLLNAVATYTVANKKKAAVESIFKFEGE